MIDERNSKEIVHSQQGEAREVANILAELSLLVHLKEFLEAHLRGDDSDELARVGNSLRSDLAKRYTRWQSFGDEQQGLNSGSDGEAFVRLLGVGVMEDMPQFFEVERGFKSTCKVDKTPEFEGEKVPIEVETFVGQRPNIKGCRFVFNTSVEALVERINDLHEERELLGKNVRA